MLSPHVDLGDYSPGPAMNTTGRSGHATVHSATCWLIIATGLVLVCALPAEAAQAATLQGTWIATKAEQDRKAADDLVGHRLSFMDYRFEIRSRDDRPLYAGTVQIKPKGEAGDH